ncbi:hypothetical protein ARMGADRAFT_1168141 [Armillaria gallica]|uniref:Uncharacterized protein n=1 Tax=Armillaria gallica TaxID=47427 RepID=A0A2H3DL94_ARMGA|nr:hypothetical protein ARMGADRAFT_1168141 [Armillaria gallica]
MSSEQSTSHRSPLRVSCCFATSLSFVIVVAIFFVTLVLKLRPGGGSLYTVNPDSTVTDRTIFLNAVLVSADIPQTSMLVEWFVDADTCKVNCPEVNIFFDTNLSPSDDSSDCGPSSNNRPTYPIFVWNPTGGVTLMVDSNYSDSLGNSPTFRTKFNIYPLGNYSQHSSFISHKSLAYYYPFDVYWAGIFAFAQEVSTNKSVNLALDSSSSLIVGFKITTDMRKDPLEDIGVQQEVIEARVTLQRSTFVIGYCLVITLTFWMVTLTICFIMITTVVFGFRQRNEIVVVPIGIVFAFTQLRSTMPGAPEGFGDILDFVGLLPCLVLLSICAVTMAGIYLFADPDHPSRRAFNWDELVDVLLFFKQRIWNTVNEWVQWAQFRIRTARRKPSNIIEIPSTNLAGENRA